MASIEIYSKAVCPFCDRAKALLKSKGAQFKEIKVDQDSEQLNIMIERSGRRTVPQIFINDEHIGGFDDLWALHQAGELDAKLV
ncbi:MAG: glutaredoxin 3 [Gammaproteobacteria bacterium RIFCSPHIGHO2_12_FULL_41_15]|nr:MAG: glutaredoxin 3 [Gammaproteobacteria bacterium RIFCSPHIGHO2_12_FULL_41_15]